MRSLYEDKLLYYSAIVVIFFKIELNFVRSEYLYAYR